MSATHGTSSKQYYPWMADLFNRFVYSPTNSFPLSLSPSLPQEIMLFIQNLPTARWKDQEVEVLLAEAYKLKFMFADAPGHLTARKT